jgi:hypothetical protein
MLVVAGAQAATRTLRDRLTKDAEDLVDKERVAAAGRLREASER